ncbi:MAG: NUDIX hydrolase [Candidatus Nanoarchaeia archaeon]
MNKHYDEKILGIEALASGHWLRIEKIIYSDHAGKRRDWESVARNKAKGAVAIVPVLIPTRNILLVSQFRPPANGRVLEFPAGLVDREEEVERTALRELKEETGYIGKILRIFPASFSSPGLSSEAVHLAIAEIDENAEENLTPVPEPDDGESLEVHKVRAELLSEFIDQFVCAGGYVDSKVLSFSIGLKFNKSII